MSEIRTDTISAANGTDPVTLTKQSAAKAYGHVAADASLNYSLNISGGVDNSTGKYTLSFTTGFSNTRYPTPSTAQNGSDRSVTVGGPTTSSFILECFDQSGANADSTIHTVSFGELA